MLDNFHSKSIAGPVSSIFSSFDASRFTSLYTRSCQHLAPVLRAPQVKNNPPRSTRMSKLLQDNITQRPDSAREILYSWKGSRTTAGFRYALLHFIHIVKVYCRYCRLSSKFNKTPGLALRLISNSSLPSLLTMKTATWACNPFSNVTHILYPLSFSRSHVLALTLFNAGSKFYATHHLSSRSSYHHLF